MHRAYSYTHSLSASCQLVTHSLSASCQLVTHSLSASCQLVMVEAKFNTVLRAHKFTAISKQWIFRTGLLLISDSYKLINDSTSAALFTVVSLLAVQCSTIRGFPTTMRYVSRHYLSMYLSTVIV